MGTIPNFSTDRLCSSPANGAMQSATAVRIITGGIGPAAIRTLVLEMRATVWLVASHPTNGYRVHVDIRETRSLSSTTWSLFERCPGQIRRNSKTLAQILGG